MKITDNLIMLVDPVYTARRLSRCSTTGALWRMTKAWLDDGKRRFVYWFVPPQGHKIVHDFDPIEEDKRITTIPIFYRSDRFREAYRPTDEHYKLVKEWSGKYSNFDVLLTTRNAGAYYRQITGCWNRYMRLMVLSERFPMFDFKKSVLIPSADYGKRAGALRNLVNYSCFDHIYISTAFEKQGIISTAKTYLSHSEVRRLEKRIHALDSKDYLDLEWPRTSQARDCFVNASPFVVFYLQRILKFQEQFEKVHKALSIIHSKLAAKMDIKVKIFESASRAKSIGKLKNDMEFLDAERLPQAEFWEYLRNGNVFISMSVEEGLPTGLVEACNLGVIGIVNRARWSEDLFGKDYFGLVKNLPEALALVRWIYKNRENAWSKWLSWYEDHFIPKMESVSGGREHFLKVCNEYFTELAAGADWTKAAQAIARGAKAKRLKRLDMMHLENVETLSKDNRVDRRTFEYWNVIYYRLPFRWRTYFRLRALDGWRADQEPWILTK